MPPTSNVVQFVPKPKMQKTKEPAPFTPLTGNPENGDYADWLTHLQMQGTDFQSKDPSTGD